MEPRTDHCRSSERLAAFRSALDAFAGNERRSIERIDVDRKGQFSALCFERPQGASDAAGSFVGVRAVGDGSRLDVFRPEEDPRLFPEVPPLLIAARVRPGTEALVATGYRPLKRVVFRAGSSGERRFLRFTRKAPDATALEVVSRSGVFPLLERTDECGRVFVQTWQSAPGESLRSLLADGRESTRQLARAGRAVARVASTQPARMNVGPEAVNRLVADALRARAKLGLIEPGLLSVSDRLLSRTIEDIRIYAPFTVVACHGDLHEGQILFDQDGDCRLIDPDAISRAPLEWDVANLSAHLVLESRLARLGRVGALEKALLGGFLEGLSAPLASDFSLRRFAALKRLAVARLICVHGCRPGMLERVPGLVAWLRDQIRVEDRVRSIGRAGRSIDSNREARCGR